MGKTKKQKKKARTLAHPYERPSAAAAPPKQGMATSEDEGETVGVSTAADASLSVAAATASAGEEAEQLQQPSAGEGESEGGEESKGRLLQRHKAEWKKVRQQIDTLKRQRTKWKKKDFRQNEERKRVTKQLKDLEDEMRQRHEKELREWDARHSSGSTARTSTPTTVDSSGVDLAKLAASFGLPQPSGDDAMARE